MPRRFPLAVVTAAVLAVICAFKAVKEFLAATLRPPGGDTPKPVTTK